MNRGQFIRNAGMAAFGLTFSQTSFTGKSMREGIPAADPAPKTAGELNRYMNSWVQLKKQIPDIEFIHLPQGCSYQWVTV